MGGSHKDPPFRPTRSTKVSSPTASEFRKRCWLASTHAAESRASNGHTLGMVDWSTVKLAKRTYSIPPELAIKFETAVSSGERSQLVATLLEEWLAARDRERLREQILEGFAEMSGVYVEVAKEWQGPSEETWDRDA